MTTVFITGLSGAGKSYTLERLKEQGFIAIDMDNGYTKNIKNGDIEETVLDEGKLTGLLNEHKDSHLFIAGIYSNQIKFYNHFDYIVLLTAELDAMIKRIDKRTSNHFGKSPEEKEKVVESFNQVLPLLKNSADIIIDTTHTDVDDICVRLKSLLFN